MSVDRQAPREVAYRLHDRLTSEYANVMSEYQHLRRVIDQLRRDYDESKEFDCFRRYARLKRMIKRSVIHLRLQSSKDESSSVHLSLYLHSQQQNEQRQRSLRISSQQRLNIGSFNLYVTGRIN